MKSKNSDSNNRRGFAAMDPDKRREAAKKGGHASRSKEELNRTEVSEPTFARGFAAMDEEKRKQIAKRGGSVSRRNRISRQEQIVIL
ncbi:MAG: Stress-induced bacterial acidophilic repeat motif [Cytophagaceae bacterium]|jgi:general stress protein YciG|nr:Stress-induced bacterial acidophilic repeat motif [Cytophagaceae bacterium]